MKIKKIYLLTFMEFGGDKYVYYTTNKSWFDWIYTNEENPLQSMVTSLLNNPKLGSVSTREECIRFLSTQLVGNGSFENDKALKLMILCQIAPDKSKDLVEWVTINKFEIDGEYEGYVY